MSNCCSQETICLQHKVPQVLALVIPLPFPVSGLYVRLTLYKFLLIYCRGEALFRQKNGMGYITFGVAVWSNLVLIVCRTVPMPICQERTTRVKSRSKKPRKKSKYWLHLCNLDGRRADIPCGMYMRRHFLR